MSSKIYFFFGSPYRCWQSEALSDTYRQKKPELNEQVFKWYASNATQRRMAKNMGCNRKTVIRKFLFVAWLARQEHERRVKAGELKTSFVQFDEMETFEHTRLKPLSIAIAVRAKTGEIIEAQVAEMNCHGKAAPLSQQLYGWRQDNRATAREDVLRMVKAVARPNITIVSDAKRAYPREVEKWVPGAEFVAVTSRVKARKLLTDATRRNQDDSMWALNQACARIRHDMSRMARKVWVTTKKAERLQAHLDLYIAYNNGYKLTA
jgi:hypothetical protein